MPKKELKRRSARFLGAPDVDLSTPGVLASYCYALLPIALAGLGALGSFFTAFEVPLRWSAVLWTGAACVLLCCAQALAVARLEHKWRDGALEPDQSARPKILRRKRAHSHTQTGDVKSV